MAEQTIERRAIRGRVERAHHDGEGNRTIEGYAAVFYRDGTPGTEYDLWPGEIVERIAPGAFDRAIRERQDVRALFNHDPNELLGRTASGSLKLAADSEGLWYSVAAPGTRTGDDVLALVDRGDITGSSFAFVVRKEEWQVRDDGPDIRTILDVDLYDVSPVTYPAYEGTSAMLAASDDRLSERIAEAVAARAAWLLGHPPDFPRRRKALTAIRKAETIY